MAVRCSHGSARRLMPEAVSSLRASSLAPIVASGAGLLLLGLTLLLVASGTLAVWVIPAAPGGPHHKRHPARASGDARPRAGPTGLPAQRQGRHPAWGGRRGDRVCWLPRRLVRFCSLVTTEMRDLRLRRRSRRLRHCRFCCGLHARLRVRSRSVRLPCGRSRLSAFRLLSADQRGCCAPSARRDHHRWRSRRVRPPYDRPVLPDVASDYRGSCRILGGGRRAVCFYRNRHHIGAAFLFCRLRGRPSLLAEASAAGLCRRVARRPHPDEVTGLLGRRGARPLGHVHPQYERAEEATRHRDRSGTRCAAGRHALAVFRRPPPSGCGDVEATHLSLRCHHAGHLAGESVQRNLCGLGDD